MVEYDSLWPSLFMTAASRLRESLGEIALRIDHIGSTAVDGLAAKPIVDIQVSVASFEPLDLSGSQLNRRDSSIGQTTPSGPSATFVSGQEIGEPTFMCAEPVRSPSNSRCCFESFSAPTPSEHSSTRTLRLTLTDRGHEAVRPAMTIVRELLDRLLAPLGGLDDPRTAAFVRDLTALLDAPLDPPSSERKRGHA